MDEAKLAANRQYYRNFKERNPDILVAKHECKLCGGRYSYYAKSNHNKTLRHRTAVTRERMEAAEALMRAMGEDETLQKLDATSAPDASITV